LVLNVGQASSLTLLGRQTESLTYVLTLLGRQAESLTYVLTAVIGPPRTKD
jgi:hypothetical protein